jgi:hypothetical protein
MRRCRVRHPNDGWRCVYEAGHSGNHLKFASVKDIDISKYEPDDGGEIASFTQGIPVPPGTPKIVSAVMGKFMPTEAMKFPKEIEVKLQAEPPPLPIAYKNEWEPNSLNQEYWDEVLVGQRIVKVNRDGDGIRSLTLDNGEIVYCSNIYVIGHEHRKDDG